MGHYVSFIIHSWLDECDKTMHWQVRRVRDGEEFLMPDAVFVVRTWVDDDECLVRGKVCHLQSGCEVQFQSGERLIDFIRNWIDNDAPNTHRPASKDTPPAPDSAEQCSSAAHR